MTWLGAWSLSEGRRITNVERACPRWRCVSRHCYRGQASSHIDRIALLERKRQVNRHLLTLRQPMLELCRVMNQHILPGKRLGSDQA